MKSLFSGALLGLLTGGIAAGAASVIAPQPAGNTPPAAPQVQAPQATNDAPVPVETQPDVAEVAQAATDTAAPQSLDAEAPATLPDADTTPLKLPEATDVSTDLDAPLESDVPVIAAGTEDPVLPNPQSVAPQVPVSEDDLVVSTAPAAEPVAVIEDVVEDAPAPLILVEEPEPAEEVAVAETAPEAETVPEVVDAPEVISQAPAEVVIPDPQDTDVAALEAEDAAPATEDAPALEAPSAGDTGPVIVDETATAPATAPTAPSPEASPPVVISLNDGRSGSRLPQGVSDIPVNRATGGDNAASGEDATVEAAPIDPDAPAIDQFAAAFENPDDRPTMSIMLMDDGSLADAAAALAKVPFPVTVVLDPTVPSASEAMTAYRAAGIEVAVLAALPEGARPSDVEVAFAAAFGALPQSVALVDPGAGNLQGDRAVMAQAMANLAEDGRGLVTVSRGLNTSVQAAEDAGVPTGLIFRDLDSEGQNARVVGRFLDQAAFRARQEPGVILLGRVRTETLAALAKWGVDNRSGQIAMAPVSAVLSAE